MIMISLDKFTFTGLLKEEQAITLSALSIAGALMIGEVARLLWIKRNLPISIEVRIGDSIIYYAFLPGSISENQWWIDCKARVVLLIHHSTLYEQKNASKKGIDWHKENNLVDETHTIHRGGLPLITKDKGFVGVLTISGIPRLKDN